MAKYKDVVYTLDISTEEKIKEAAREVFYQKGYAATRTRDIAEKADINIALLNYYFRSKEKLFNIIMMETVIGFMNSMAFVLNDKETDIEKKVEMIVCRYIDFIVKEPSIPIFILNEIRTNTNKILEKLSLKHIIVDSVFFKQHQQAVENGEIIEPNPWHFLMNLLSLVLFPFVGRPLLQEISGLDKREFNKLMQERKKLIPVWIKAVMQSG